MLNNITNFYNLIKTGKVKTQLDATDLLPIGTKDLRFSGQYQPTMIKYGDFISGLVGGSNGQVLFNDNDTIAGASTFYWDKVNNRVGIGTSTPASPLDVRGFNELIRMTATGGGTTIRMQNSFGSTWNVGSTGNDFYWLYNGVSSFMTLTSNGNLLINTTTDSGFKLDVNGTARVVGPTFAVGDWTSRSTSVYVRALTGGSENRGFFIGYGASNDGNGGSFTYQPTGNVLNIRSPYNSGTIALSFEGNTNSTQFHNTSGVVHSKIFANTGNWGINTTTDAGYKLDVNGTARVKGTGATGSTIAFTVQNSAGTDLMRVFDNGQILLSQTINTINIGGTNYSQNEILCGVNNFAVRTNVQNRSVSLSSGNTVLLSANFWSGAPSGAIGGVAISDDGAPNVIAGAVLNLVSKTKGFLPPRMDSTQKNAISGPAPGLMIYDTTLNRPCFYNGTTWITL